MDRINKLVEKIIPDTIENINDEYNQHYVIAWYKNNVLQKIRVDNSDGAAGDISSGCEYCFVEGSRVLIESESSYFMADGCGISELLYFKNENLRRLLIFYDCYGENEKMLERYIGMYTFSYANVMESYRKNMEHVKIER